MADKKKTPPPAAAVQAAPPSPGLAAAAAAVDGNAPGSTGPEVTPPETRRGPGRPKGSGTAAPVSPSEASSAAAPKKGPGRPKGGAKSKVSFDSTSKGQLAKQLQGLHMLAALGTGIPELQLDDEAATLLSEAVANVCEEYDLSLSGKTGAMIQLIAAAAMVYVPKMAQVSMRVRAAKAEKQRAGLHVVGGTDGTAPAGT